MSRLLLSGEPVPVVTDAEGLPVRFTWRGDDHVVETSLTRWRVDLFWWRSRVCRDYFKVITASGWVIVLYRDNHRESWHVQRIYD